MSDVLESQKKLVALKSGNICAICKSVLAEKNAALSGGEAAHIYGEKPGATRHDATKDLKWVNSEKNLIYICPKCHKDIDDVIPYEFPVKRLFEIKRTHEEFVITTLQMRINNEKISTYLTDVVIRLSSTQMTSEADSYDRSYLPYSIDDKMNINNINMCRRFIDEYKQFQTYLHGENGLYKISINEGGYEKRNIYNRIWNVYIEIVRELQKDGYTVPYDGDYIYLEGCSRIRTLILNSKGYEEMNDDDLINCVYILMADAFIECKWFDNPNNGGENRDSSS